MASLLAAVGRLSGGVALRSVAGMTRPLPVVASTISSLGVPAAVTLLPAVVARSMATAAPTSGGSGAPAGPAGGFPGGASADGGSSKRPLIDLDKLFKPAAGTGAKRVDEPEVDEEELEESSEDEPEPDYGIYRASWNNLLKLADPELPRRGIARSLAAIFPTNTLETKMPEPGTIARSKVAEEAFKAAVERAAAEAAAATRDDAVTESRLDLMEAFGAHDLGKMFDIFLAQTPPDRQSMYLMLEACGRAGRMDLCTKVVDHMTAWDMEVDTQSFNIAMQGLAINGDLNRMIRMFQAMPAPIRNYDSYRILVVSLANVQQYQLAFKYFNQMVRLYINPTEELYRAMLDPLFEESRWIEAFYVSRAMRKTRSLRISVPMIIHCLDSFYAGGRMDDVRNMSDYLMARWGTNPNARPAYQRAFDIYVETKDYIEAQAVLDACRGVAMDAEGQAWIAPLLERAQAFPRPKTVAEQEAAARAAAEEDDDDEDADFDEDELDDSDFESSSSSSSESEPEPKPKATKKSS